MSSKKQTSNVPICFACNKAGHFPRNKEGELTCPELMATVCEYCGLLGHRESHCEEAVRKREAQLMFEYGKNYLTPEERRAKKYGTKADVSSYVDETTDAVAKDVPISTPVLTAKITDTRKWNAVVCPTIEARETFEERRKSTLIVKYKKDMESLYGSSWAIVIEGTKWDSKSAKLLRTATAKSLFKRSLTDIYGENWLNDTEGTIHDCKYLREERDIMRIQNGGLEDLFEALQKEGFLDEISDEISEEK